MNTNIKDLENKLWEIAEARKAKGGCQKDPRRSGYPRLETQAMMRCLKKQPFQLKRRKVIVKNQLMFDLRI